MQPMQLPPMGPDITRSALIIVDMQNDFLHPDGSFSRMAMEHPEFNIDMPFLVGTIPHVKRLADTFRAAERPVVYIAHILKPDYSDAAFPYWRLGLQPGAGNSTHCVEGTWGAEIGRVCKGDREAVAAHSAEPHPVRAGMKCKGEQLGLLLALNCQTRVSRLLGGKADLFCSA
jgi:hypothetical protein